MLKWIAILCLTVSTQAYGGCRDTLGYPFYECDTAFENYQMWLRLTGATTDEEPQAEQELEDEQYEPEVITSEGLYLEQEVEVIINPYEGLGEFNSIEVYEIDLNVLRRLKINPED